MFPKQKVGSSNLSWGAMEKLKMKFNPDDSILGNIIVAISVIIAVIVLLPAILFATFSFWTWLIMLAVGSLGYSQYGFWDLFPSGVLLALVVAAISKDR